jgi:hypothetical protein
VADVGLDGLFREEEPLADLAVDQTVRDELKNLDLACGRILADLACGRRSKWDDRATTARATPSRSRLEASAVVAVAVQDLTALGSVHDSPIGLESVPL